MNTFLKSVLLVATLAFAPLAQAEVEIFDLVAGTPKSMLTAPRVIEQIQVIANPTNTVVRLYDASTATTNYVQAAYTSYTSYSTNFSNTFTNEAGILVTNTFVGRYTAPVSNSASTNTIPVLDIIAASANTTVTKYVQIPTIRGLTGLATATCQLVVTYSKPTP